MATATEVDRLRRANLRVVEVATSDLRDLWVPLDTSDAMQVRRVLEEALPALTDRYGEVSAAVAADWYDEVRTSARVRGGFSPVVAAPVEAGAVQASARWAIGPLFSREPDAVAALARVEAELDRMVLQPGRDTITRSAGRDPEASGWQRVTRPGACKFCVGLADRGAVYKRSTVRFAAHTNCHCQVAPSWDRSAPEVTVEAYRASSRDRDNAATRAWLNREYPDLPG